MTRRRALLVLGILLALGVLGFQLPHEMRIVNDPEDLRAFYCAGQVLTSHHDPYLAEPLRTCENREIVAAGLTPFADLAVPAPLPVYALIPFEVLGAFDFATATTIYVILLIVAMAATTILVSRTCAFPLPATVAALILSDGLITVLNGQIFPFALLALCASAFEIARDRPRSASIYAALAAIEPHIALPALLSLAYAIPRTRVPIVVSLAVLGGAALAVAGIATNVEYLVRVLPAHALAEAAAGAQFSLTSPLYHVIHDRALAIRFGDLQYALMCVLGVWVARTAARRYDAPELLVYLPPAFAVLGGPFVHLTQIAVAIPALIALIKRVPERRNVFGLALLVLAVPWRDIVEDQTFYLLGSIATVSIVISLAVWKPNYRAAALAVATIVLLGTGERLYRLANPEPRPNPSAAIAAVAQPDRLAEATWQAFMDTTQGGETGFYFPARAPTWLALGALVVGTCTVLRTRRKPVARI